MKLWNLQLGSHLLFRVIPTLDGFLPTLGSVELDLYLANKGILS